MSSTNPSDSRSAGYSGARTPDDRTDVVHHDREADVQQRRKEEYGGFNIGAAFFGWLVAIGVTILLTAIVSGVLTAVGSQYSVSQQQATSSADTAGIVTAIILFVILLIGYYAGGYVAGRMSRFDGGRQGAGVWVIGLLVTIAVAVLGYVAGSQYDLLRQVNLPSLPISAEEATWGAIITAVAILLGTLLAAVLGGKAGQHYHTKIDRVR
jgi:amino acid transporter